MKKRFRIIAFAIAALLLMGNISQLNAKASEGGTSYDDAIAITFGQEYQKSYSRHINYEKKIKSEYYDGVYYQFSLPSSGLVRFSGQVTSDFSETFYLYNSLKQQIISFTYDDTGKLYNMYLTSGDYYLRLQGNAFAYFPNTCDFNHEFTLNYIDTKETCRETQSTNNNTIAKAEKISWEKDYVGQLGQNDKIDCYQFELESSGRVTFDISVNSKKIIYTLYDESGNKIDSLTQSNSGNADFLSRSTDLTKGTYYISLSADNENCYGTYSFNGKFDSVEESFEESGGGTNNTINTASPIESGKEYKGQIALNDSYDYYKITMPASGTLEVIGSSDSLETVALEFYSAAGNRLVSNSFSANETGTNNFTLKRKCEAGDYYVCVSRRSGKTGNYTLSAKITIPVSGVALDQSSLELHEGDKVTLVAEITPEEATDKSLIWSSSNANVASVDESGNVTAKLAGTAVITALAADGSELSASCTMTVLTNEQIVYRLYNHANYEHLYTTDANEVRVLVTTCGWEYEGSAWIAPTSGYPVYRLNNSGLQNHLYTTDENEVRVLTTQYGWELDNDGAPLFYSGGSQNIYRLYKEDLNGMHLLSTDLNEYNVLGSPAQGWAQEGIKLNCLAIGDNQYPFP